MSKHRNDEESANAYKQNRTTGVRARAECQEIMTQDVTVATRETMLIQVAAMMRDGDTGVIPIVDANNTSQEREHQGKLIGLVTDRDIVVRAIAAGKDARITPVAEVMTTDVHTALPTDRVIDVIRKMGDKQVRRVPVVDESGNLRGIISMADVALETEADEEVAHALEEISSGDSFWSKMVG